MGILYHRAVLGFFVLKNGKMSFRSTLILGINSLFTTTAPHAILLKYHIVNCVLLSEESLLQDGSISLHVYCLCLYLYH